MRILFVTAALLISSSAFAQTRSTPPPPPATTPTTMQPVAFGPKGLLIGAEGELALPVGNFGDIAGFGIGGYLTGEFKLPQQPNLTLTGRAGLQLHLSKSIGTVSSSVQLLPVLVGARFYLQSAQQQGAFVTAETGFNFVYHHLDAGSFGSDSGLDLDIDLGVGAGYQMGAFYGKLMFESVNIAHFGDALQITLGGGLYFAGL